MECVILGDSPVDIRDDNLVVVSPSEHVTFAPRRALVSCGHTEHHFIHTFAEIEIFLQKKNDF